LNKLEISLKRIDLELVAEERRLDLHLREQEARHRWEIERLQQLAGLNIEALIAASDIDRAQLLGELAKMDRFRSLSEEQILAMVADKSPEVARAFQEKFRGISAEERAALYERLLGDRDVRIDELKDSYRHHTETVADLFKKAQDTLADTAKGVASQSGSGSGPIIVSRGEDVFHSSPDRPDTKRVILCPRCQIESNVGVKFCSNCSYQFYE
jgi:hypothetical protein